MTRIQLSAWQLALLAAIFVVGVNNVALFQSLAKSLDPLSLDGASFLMTLGILMVVVLNALFLASGPGWLMKVVIATVLVASAVFSYFSNELGVIFDEGMFANIAATIIDRNVTEATELASGSLLRHVLEVGVLPSLVLLFVTVTRTPALVDIGTRVVALVICVAVLAAIALSNYQYISYFGVQHRELRYKAMPVYPMMSLVRLARDKLHTEPPFRVIDADAVQAKPTSRRTVGIMVVGETARADHFSLNGYARQTNPELESESDVIFMHGDSCGTSTIYSVPCMFSMRGRDTYEPGLAKSESNVLDILNTAGVRTVWIDNNSSCKHVCDRTENYNLRQSINSSSPFYSDSGYYDEVLLQQVDRYLVEENKDLMIVLHMLGSHGPAYSRRYPPGYETFAPSCGSAAPQDCSSAEVTNAYDNTIVYTDHVLGQLIERLRARSSEIDSFLFYASDHGESLGEGGVYLHGLPYQVAPRAQTDVPFVVWRSASMRKGRGGPIAADAATKHPTHDNISHTLLGLFGVSARSYRADLDLFKDSASVAPNPG